MSERLSVSSPDDERWLPFLESQAQATVFHHPAWARVLTESYGYRSMIVTETNDENEIVAGMPVTEMRGILRRRRYSSLPFTDHCPPIAATATALSGFTRDLVRWRALLGAREIVVHGALAATPGVQLVTRAVRHVLPLDPSSERVLAGARSAVQRHIRKAQRLGVRVRQSQSRADLDPFYRLHLETRRRLGVPIQPRRFIEALWTHVISPGLGFVIFAYQNERPIAAALFLAWNGNLIYKFGASDPRYWEYRPNNLVMWTAIDWACRHGYRSLCFGRTELDNQGLRDFKRSWGSLETPLLYSYVGAMPAASVPKLPMRALATLIQSSPPIVCRAIGEVFYGRVQRLA